MRKMFRRREILSTAAILSIAGCAETPSIGNNNDDSVQLGNIRLANSEDDSLQITVKIEEGEDFVFQNKFTIEPGQDKVIEREWPSEPGDYTLSYAAKEKIQNFDLPEDAADIDGGCIDTDIIYTSGLVDIIFHGDHPAWGGC